MSAIVMSTDPHYAGRLIRSVRHERAPNVCRISIEEQYLPNEPYEWRVDDVLMQDISIITTWRWRVVFTGCGVDYTVALALWLKRMREHPEAGPYAAVHEVNSGHS